MQPEQDKQSSVSIHTPFSVWNFSRLNRVSSSHIAVSLAVKFTLEQSVAQRPGLPGVNISRRGPSLQAHLGQSSLGASQRAEPHSHM